MIIQQNPSTAPCIYGILALNFIQDGLKKALKSIEFDLLNPADILI